MPATPTTVPDAAPDAPTTPASVVRLPRPLPVPAAPSSRPRLRGLDGLRFVAAVTVVLYHFAAYARYEDQTWGEQVTDAVGPIGVVASYGALGPYLFFVISGFVILMTAWGRDVPHFLASRAGRLFPAYWVAVLATATLLIAIWNPGRSVSWETAGVNLTMFQRAFGISHVDGVYWTLWVEMRFYLLVLVFLLVGITRRRIELVAGLWPLVALIALQLDLGVLPYWLIANEAPFFAAGMAIFLIHRHGHTVLRWMILLVNTGLGVAYLDSSLVPTISENTENAPSRPLMAVLVVACVAAVAAVSWGRAAHLGSRSRRLGAVLTLGGALTYPLYLIHQYWGWWVTSMLASRLPSWVVLLAALGFSLMAAALVHYAVERRFGPAVRDAVLRFCERVRLAGRSARPHPVASHGAVELGS
ncbi:acyltransferase 3 [Beutenbergia cavernae DSM 12333]|uniref:Acyltransferase 3 n=1 Tax=Beutenbergia cavernae (strain ATCC BAA-8 / DSM 12333 / CCUG 43141 / JCM 11478 / NBRC 16432 / NCIMB 13614 / HKI 0122) TaxID=471853 RepID=C5C116_BEUC1|nr:acyltransferase [Beutenbergia cavernae]ACQ79420.1 acyltransferase 3 [Beutenbergia cavernae DSM 12333]